MNFRDKGRRGDIMGRSAFGDVFRFATLIALVTLWGQIDGLASQVVSCPKECSCYGVQVDCSERGLTAVPKGIPRNAEKM